MSALRSRALHVVVSVALGAVFLYACADKIAHPADFARIVYHYQLVGPSQRLGYLPANLLAVTLPWVEAVAGALLVLNLWRREAAATTALMLVAFLVGVGWALAHGIDIQNCGCFKVSGEGRAAGVKLVLQDLGLLAGALLLAVWPPSGTRADAPVVAGTEP